MTTIENGGEILDAVIKAIEKAAKIEITEQMYDTNLFSMGLDSIKAIQIVNDLEDTLDIVIDDSNLPKFTTISNIAGFISKMRV